MRQALSVTAIIAAYNEEDVIGPVVADLMEQGVRVHLLDHASTDGTVAEVERLRERGSLTIERLKGGEFSLAQIIRRKEILAAELDSDWFVNADADEFRESPWPGVNFVDGIREVDRLGFNAVDFAVLNFLPVDDSFRKGDDPRDAFRFCESAGAFDRLQIRCWKKQPGPLDLVSTGGHEARFPGRRVFPLRFLLRHYPIRGQAHGERKVLQERLPRFAPEERSRGWHVQYDAVKEGGSFLRESSTLMPFDPWSARVALALHHRGVETLEETVAARERDLSGARADLAASRDAADSLRERIASLEREQAAARDALAHQDAQVEALRRERDVLFEGLGGLRVEREALLRERTERVAQHEALMRLHGEALASAEALRGDVGRLQSEGDALRAEGVRCQARLAAVSEELVDAIASHEQRQAALQYRLQALLGSRAWRWTAPLRAVLDLLRSR